MYPARVPVSAARGEYDRVARGVATAVVVTTAVALMVTMARAEDSASSVSSGARPLPDVLVRIDVARASLDASRPLVELAR